MSNFVQQETEPTSLLILLDYDYRVHILFGLQICGIGTDISQIILNNDYKINVKLV